MPTTAVSLLAAALLSSVSSAHAAQPEIWMGSVNTNELGRDPAAWPWVADHLDGLQCAMNALAFLSPSEDLEKLVPILKEKGIKIGIEGGYFDWQSRIDDFSTPNPKGISDRVREDFSGDVGRETAETEIKKIVHLTNAGGVPDYLILDGAIRRFTKPGEDVGRKDIEGITDFKVIAHHLSDYMKTWRAACPKVQFVIISNFPNWGWKGAPSYTGALRYGDYHAQFNEVMKHLQGNAPGLVGLRADCPYDYVIEEAPISREISDPLTVREPIDWLERLGELKMLGESYGLHFQFVVNDQNGGGTSGELFHKKTLNAFDAIHASGLSPAWYIVQTWYPHPKKVMPENEYGTMSALTKDVIQHLQAAGRVAE